MIHFLATKSEEVTTGRSRNFFGTLAVAIVALASVQTARSAPPHIGYVYPAGGRLGTALELEIGGQYLGDPSGLVFSGGGVTYKIIDHNKLPSAQVISDYRDKLNTIKSEFRALEQGPEVSAREVLPTIQELLTGAELSAKKVMQIEDYSRRRNDPKRQLNNQIGESVRVRILIDENAVPGARYCRLQTAGGLSNPMRFVIGDLPEYREPEAWSFDLTDYLGVETAPNERRGSDVIGGPIALPATINGRILPGEVDEFPFEAREGDKVVVSVQARDLVPYLADAVPGWFQAVVSLEDPRGRELAFSDDYRFNPDPVLFYKIPRDGEYRIKIHDSIYRGREDFVYRITVGELPFLTGISPLGGQAGAKVDLAFQGGNLIEQERKGFVLPETTGITKIQAKGEVGLSNPVAFHVEDVPEEVEREGNDRLGAAKEIEIPSIMNGSIGREGDYDFYRVNGTGNKPITFEIFARRLGSPLDSNLTVFDDDGNQIAWNDDFENPTAGLTTHHADARITVDMPSDGRCFVKVGDTQHQGGPEFAYRLKVMQGPPDIALRATPSSITARTGATGQCTVHALRLDGFDGPIRIELKSAPEGYSIRPVTIAAGEESCRVSISVPDSETEEPVKIELQGTAIVDGRDAVTLDVVPAEDMTQAFITKHLVAVDDLLVEVRTPPERPAPTP